MILDLDNRENQERIWFCTEKNADIQKVLSSLLPQVKLVSKILRTQNRDQAEQVLIFWGTF